MVGAPLDRATLKDSIAQRDRLSAPTRAPQPAAIMRPTDGSRRLDPRAPKRQAPDDRNFLIATLSMRIRQMLRTLLARAGLLLLVAILFCELFKAWTVDADEPRNFHSTYVSSAVKAPHK
jgi:hypothetical protein